MVIHPLGGGLGDRAVERAGVLLAEISHDLARRRAPRHNQGVAGVERHPHFVGGA